jgi:hypothetical protein
MNLVNMLFTYIFSFYPRNVPFAIGETYTPGLKYELNVKRSQFMNTLLSRLSKVNPHLTILPLEDGTFTRYGRVLAAYHPQEMISRAQAILPLTEGIVYEPSIPALEVPSALNSVIEREIYGGMPVQVGWCYGKNLQMAGLEYHKGSEVIVCLTDQVLLVGDERDIDYGQDISYDIAKVAAFFAPAGSVIEFHPWNLHYAPIQATAAGQFATLVYLPRGTNYPLSFPVPQIGENRLLFAVNKWLLVHPAQVATIAQGAYPGLAGEDIFITPV